jgi:transcriptional regulator with XRE-family HTH domain
MQGVLGSKLKKARTELGLSQAAFARALGFSSEFISLFFLPSAGEIRPDVRGLLPDARFQGPGDRREGVRPPPDLL